MTVEDAYAEAAAETAAVARVIEILAASYADAHGLSVETVNDTVRIGRLRKWWRGLPEHRQDEYRRRFR